MPVPVDWKVGGGTVGGTGGSVGAGVGETVGTGVGAGVGKICRPSPEHTTSPQPGGVSSHV